MEKSNTSLELLHLSSREVPPGGLSYRINALCERAPRLAWVGPFNSDYDLLNEVNKRERANGLPLSTLGDIHHQVCGRLPPGYCRDARGARTTKPGSGALGLAEVVAGTKALIGWFKHGSVDEAEIIRRTYVCNDCPMNLPIAGCQGCAASSLYSLINAIVVKPLPSDAVLGSCAVCKCSLKSKVRMKLDDLPPLTPAQREQLPERCWIIADASEQRNDPRI